MNQIVNLNITNLSLAYIFIFMLLVIVKIKGISREKLIIVATIRMTVQLMLAGFVLVFLFDNINPYYTILVLCLMEFFAINTILKRIKNNSNKKLKRLIIISMVLGTITTILYFVLVVLNLTPWYDARYFIPISGMLIGNSMTGITLGVTNLIDGVHNQRQAIENSLMLGASPKTAIKTIVDKAFDSAIIPTINTMIGTGIVFLPGMMTGQILAGASPMTAIQYQIAIILGIVGSVSLTVFIFVQLSSKTFFNKDNQLI